MHGLICACCMVMSTDFAVGKEIHVNGSDLLIHGCDEFTREYYEKMHGVRFDDIPMKFE